MRTPGPPRLAIVILALVMASLSACAPLAGIDGDVVETDGATRVDGAQDGTGTEGGDADGTDGPGDGGTTITIDAPHGPPGDVALGDHGVAVDELQFMLKLATGQRLDEDGAFGPATLALLHTFQSSVGLPQSSVADAATRASLEPLATAAARRLSVDYGATPSRFAVPSPAEIAINLAAAPVVSGVGDHTASYMGRVGLAWGDGAESTGITQGSPAHIEWVAFGDVSPSDTRAIGTISRNEGPFDATNSYDAGDYTWGAYQLIGSYRTSPYLPAEDELSRGLAYIKQVDPEAFWHAFQRYGFDVAYTVDSGGRVVPSSVVISLALTDGTTLTGRAVWMATGTQAQLNQVFINASQDPRIQRGEIIGAKRTHFDVLSLPLSSGRPAASAYLTSERAVACFLDMELNIGRGTTQRSYAAAVDAVARSRSIDPAGPATWPEIDRAAIEADVLQAVLGNAPSATYAARMRRVLGSYFLSDAAHSFL
ncbi:MAG: peptidoglycan-binding domain-containing protein [Deltaproteobacteria bacterium]